MDKKGQTPAKPGNVGDPPAQFPEKVNFTLLPGEKLISFAKLVTHICPYDGPCPGTLYVTNYKLIFENSEPKENISKRTTDWKGNAISPFSSIPGPEVPLGMIARVDKIGGQANRKENAYGIDILCNDLRSLRFGFIPENHSRKHIYKALLAHAFPASNSTEFFAFSYSEAFEGPVNGWDLYDATRELSRIIDGNPAWRISQANSSYNLCRTYPCALGVPASIDDDFLDAVAEFRKTERIPVLSWLHPRTRASITRCSQPKAAVGRRSEQDEQLIRAIRAATPGDPPLSIVDARPKVNAVANQAKGGGYENTEVYEKTKIVFMNIPNIHVIRESYKRLRDACFPRAEDAHWYSKVEDSRWLEYIRLILQAALDIVKLVDREGTSVLIHCSDGWDRTPQLSSLAMLLLDPYYRTLPGFCVLIEKEWLAFGHKFSQRLGHGSKDFTHEQRSPIFIQFLDCVYQVLYQFPCSFEFNEELLSTIADEVFTCRFGTFLFDSEHSRLVENKVKEKTRSLWSSILSRSKVFTNPLYLRQNGVLYPVASSRKLHVWTSYFLRWNPQMKKVETAEERHWELRSLVDDLQNKILELEKQLER